MIYTSLQLKGQRKNNIKLDAEIINEFQGVINGNVIENEEVYCAMTAIIELLRINLNEYNITKPDEFIKDLINAFDAFYRTEICEVVDIYNDYTLADTPETFIEVREEFITELLRGGTTFKRLSEITYCLVEIEDHEEFKTLHERMTSDYYTS